MFQVVKKTTKNVMSPKGVLLDFEEALAEGFVKVFPDAAVLADFFHFVSYHSNSFLFFFLTQNRYKPMLKPSRNLASRGGVKM